MPARERNRQMELDTIKKLCDEELNRSIVKQLGGTLKPCECGLSKCPKNDRWHWPDGTITNDSPDYATSLDDMALAEKIICERVLEKPRLDRYLAYLKILQRNCWPLSICFATARQRAEAFVAVMEKAP